MLVVVALGLAAAVMAAQPGHHIRGVVMGWPGQGPAVPLSQVRVQCFGTDGSAHDDVPSPVTDAKGRYSLAVPTRYASFRLVFMDTRNQYWPRELQLSPTADPTRLKPIVLQSQHEQLTTAQRNDVESIQRLLVASNPHLAQALLNSLNNQPGPDVRFALTGRATSSSYPLYAELSATYREQTGVDLGFLSPTGSGIAQIKAPDLAFAATDVPLNPDEQQTHHVIQWPMLISGVVPVVHLPGIDPGKLVIDGSTLADIYLGRITNWDDPALRKLNPSIELPDARINVIHRSDGSGATAVFTDYLSKRSPRWKEMVGSGTAVAWPVGVGAKGDEGVAAAMADINMAIGYVDYRYAHQNKLVYVDMVNADGRVVAPGVESLQSAVAAADWQPTTGFFQRLTDQPGADTWPLTGASYIVMPKQVVNDRNTLEILKFFDWSFKNGGQAARARDYVPLPDAVVRKVHESWMENLRDADGMPVWREGEPLN